MKFTGCYTANKGDFHGEDTLEFRCTCELSLMHVQKNSKCHFQNFLFNAQVDKDLEKALKSLSLNSDFKCAESEISLRGKKSKQRTSMILTDSLDSILIALFPPYVGSICLARHSH